MASVTELIRGNGGNINSANAREMQTRSREVMALNREMRTAQAVAQGVADAEAALETQAMRGGLAPIADKVVRRQAALILYGGPAFESTSAKEAAEIAKTFAGIAQSYRPRAPIETGGSETPTGPNPDVQRMVELAARAKARKDGQT